MTITLSTHTSNGAACTAYTYGDYTLGSGVGMVLINTRIRGINWFHDDEYADALLAEHRAALLRQALTEPDPDEMIDFDDAWLES